MITLIARLTLIAILSIAACAKLVNPNSFLRSLESFTIFPSSTLPYMVYFVPTLELLTANLLLLRNKALAGAILSTLLSIGFTASLSLGIISGSVQECGCFGDWEVAKVSPEAALLRAIIILALSTFLIVKLSRDPNSKQ
jgi:hypothetical protein